VRTYGSRKLEGTYFVGILVEVMVLLIEICVHVAVDSNCWVVMFNALWRSFTRKLVSRRITPRTFDDRPRNFFYFVAINTK
jgi:hypothetical protein